MKKSKKETIKEYLIAALLIIYFIGFSILVFITTYPGGSILKYIYYNFFLCIVLFFFIGVSIYLIYYFISDFFKSKEKIITMYLVSNSTTDKKFLNKKGKPYIYHIKNDNLKEKEFYDVILEKNNIKDIVGVSSNKFIPHYEKVSYWLNWYSPFNDIEDIVLLPFLYILPILLIFSAFTGYISTFLLFIPGLICIYLLVYDFNYKRNLIKINKLIISDDLEKNDKISKLKFKNECMKNNVKNTILNFAKINYKTKIAIVIMIVILSIYILYKIPFDIKVKENYLALSYKCTFLFLILYLLFKIILENMNIKNVKIHNFLEKLIIIFEYICIILLILFFIVIFVLSFDN